MSSKGERSSFSSRLGFVLSAAGSAVGPGEPGARPHGPRPYSPRALRSSGPTQPLRASSARNHRASAGQKAIDGASPPG